MKNKDRVLIEVYGGTNPNSELDQSGKQAATELASYEDLVKELKKSFGNGHKVRWKCLKCRHNHRTCGFCETRC